MSSLPNGAQLTPEYTQRKVVDLNQQLMLAKLRKLVCPKCKRTGAETNVTMAPLRPGMQVALCGHCYQEWMFTNVPPMEMPKE